MNKYRWHEWTRIGRWWEPSSPSYTYALVIIPILLFAVFVVNGTFGTVRFSGVTINPTTKECRAYTKTSFVYHPEGYQPPAPESGWELYVVRVRGSSMRRDTVLTPYGSCLSTNMTTCCDKLGFSAP